MVLKACATTAQTAGGFPSITFHLDATNGKNFTLTWLYFLLKNIFLEYAPPLEEWEIPAFVAATKLEMKVVLNVTSVPGHLVSEQYLSPSWQRSSVLSLPELPKTHLQNGLSTPLPSSESPSTRLSPPNVSALLDISLPGPPEDVLSQGEPATQISDSIIEIAISSGQYGKYR